MRWLFVVIALIAFGLTPAYAQSIPSPPAGKPSTADEATAKKDFESGLKLYGDSSYAEALIAFEQSYKLGGRPSALKNLAQCHRNLKHFVEAYEAYDQMLTLHEAALSAPDKKAVQQALEEIAILTGTIQISANETGADVEIDTKDLGKTPLAKPKRVSVGAHAVKVSKSGFTTFETTVNVGSQDTKKLDVVLAVEKNLGHVLVREQRGRDVHVFIDAQDKGPAPWEGDVPAGEHTIEVKSAAFASDVRKIAIASKERLDFALEALSLTGHLRVTTVPASANIKVDGRAVGTGAWEGDLPEGKHTIEVGLEGNAAQVREIVLSRGQTVVQEIPVVGAIAMGRVTEYPGFYVRVSAFAQIGLGAVPKNHESAHADGIVDDGAFALQLGPAIRVGRAFDWWGLEVVALGFFEHRDRDYKGASANPQGGTSGFGFGDQSDALNFFIGAGGRATTKDETVRFTAGLAPGIAVRSFSLRRHYDGSGSQTGNGSRFVQGTSQTSTGGSEETFDGLGYTTFGLLFDGGILLGSTPGAKFYLGVQALIDFAPKLVGGPDKVVPLAATDYDNPGRGVAIVDGVQFFIGPTLGVQFGH